MLVLLLGAVVAGQASNYPHWTEPSFSAALVEELFSELLRRRRPRRPGSRSRGRWGSTWRGSGSRRTLSSCSPGPRGWKSHLLGLEDLETHRLWSQGVAEDQIGTPEGGVGQRIPLLMFVCLHFCQIKKQKKENGDYDGALTVLNFARGVGERLERHQRLGVWLHLCRHQVVRTLQQHWLKR